MEKPNRIYLSTSGIKMHIVESTNIHAIGYLDPTSRMEVHFLNGAVYSYHPITAEGFNRFLYSQSKGKFFAENIKNNSQIEAFKESYTIDIKKTITMAKQEAPKVKSNFSVLEETVASLKENYAKFSEKGMKAGGKRARKDLMEISKLCKTIRVEIMDALKN